MNKYKNYLIVGVAILFAFSSCTKRLDKIPADAIELSRSFETMTDAEAWNAGLYSRLRGAQYGIFMYSTDVQADQLNASQEYGNRNGFPHRWTPFLAGDYTIRDVYAGYYSRITNLNVMIDGLPNVKTETDAQKSKLSRFIGDAHLARAFYYSKLVELYAKPYEPATANTDLGVPLILTYDPELRPARATVKEVYDQIMKDIAEAKSRLADVKGTAGAQNFTIDIATALEARVKLQMKDWAGAKAAADFVINSGTYPLIKTQDGLINYWHVDGRQESIMQLYVSKPNELPNTNEIYLGYKAADKKYTPDFIPSQWVVDAYSDKDYRKDAYFKSLPVLLQGENYTLTLVNKYPGNPAYFTGANTNYVQEPKVFRIAEMYLISAEAGARADGDADALAKLNSLRTARGLDALSGLTGSALLEAVKEERFKELAFEGFRLLDLKRWHEGFERHDPQNKNALISGDGFYNLKIEADADKFVWGIPSRDITVNPNLIQNKGWE